MSDTEIFEALGTLLSESGINPDAEDIELRINPKGSLSRFLDPKEGWPVEYDPEEDSMTARSPDFSYLSRLLPTVPVPYTIRVNTAYHYPNRQKDYDFVMTINPSEKTIKLDEPLVDDNLYRRVIELGAQFGFIVEGA